MNKVRTMASVFLYRLAQFIDSERIGYYIDKLRWKIEGQASE